MVFAGTNYWAMLAATVAAFVFGAVYYGTLSKPWMKAARVSEAEAKFGPALFAVTFACQLVMAFVLVTMIGSLANGQPTLGGALLVGLLVWAGFIATTMTINHRYQNAGWDLTLIDGAHWLGVALIMSLVIGLMGT